MSSKMPPVPPAERSPKGPGSDPHAMGKNTAPRGKQVPVNPAEEGQQANTRINTTNQGHQQPR